VSVGNDGHLLYVICVGASIKRVIMATHTPSESWSGRLWGFFSIPAKDPQAPGQNKSCICIV